MEVSKAYGAPARKQRRRGSCCRCCVCTTLLIILLIAGACVLLYFLYRPYRPTFAVSSFTIDALSFTSSSQSLTAIIGLNMSSRNPNKRITFSYNPMAVSVETLTGVVLGESSVPEFKQHTKSDTLLNVDINNRNHPLSDDEAKKLSGELAGKNGVDLKLAADTKVVTKLGPVKLPKVRIRVDCDGIKGTVPSGNTSTSASLADSSCKVNLKFKIWKWVI